MKNLSAINDDKDVVTKEYLDALDRPLKLAQTWEEAVTNAKSEIVVCVYDSTNVYSVTIPRAEITAAAKTFFQGGAYATSSLNHVQVAVSTTAITAGWYFNGSSRSTAYRVYYR